MEISKSFMTSETILFYLCRELKNNYDAFIMLDLLIKIYKVGEAFNNIQPTIDDWYNGMITLMSYKNAFTWFDGQFHIIYTKDEYIPSTFPSIKAQMLNAQLCNFIIKNSYYHSPLIINEQMVHKWLKYDINTEYFIEQCLHNVQHNDIKIIAKSLLSQNEKIHLQTKLIKVIIIIILVQILLSLITFANAEEVCIEYDNYTMCEDIDYNVTIIMEVLPCKFCNMMFEIVI